MAEIYNLCFASVAVIMADWNDFNIMLVRFLFFVYLRFFGACSQKLL